MPLGPKLESLLRNLRHGAEQEQEVGEELDSYLELLIDEKLRVRSF